MASGTADQLNVMSSNGWNVEYAFVGWSKGVPGAPGPAPLTLKLSGGDHAPWTNAPLTAWTRQK